MAEKDASQATPPWRGTGHSRDQGEAWRAGRRRLPPGALPAGPRRPGWLPGPAAPSASRTPPRPPWTRCRPLPHSSRRCSRQSARPCFALAAAPRPCPQLTGGRGCQSRVRAALLSPARLRDPPLPHRAFLLGRGSARVAVPPGRPTVQRGIGRGGGRNWSGPLCRLPCSRQPSGGRSKDASRRGRSCLGRVLPERMKETLGGGRNWDLSVTTPRSKLYLLFPTLIVVLKGKFF